MSIDDQTDQLDREINNMRSLEQKVKEYKLNHAHKAAQTEEKITELANLMTISGKNMVNVCEEKLKKFAAIIEPYLNSGVAKSKEGELPIIDRYIALIASIEGLDSTIRKTSEVSRLAAKHHKILYSIDVKQREAIARHERLTRIQNLNNEFPSGSPLHLLAVLPALLMTLDRNPKCSDYYKKKFGEMQGRILTLFATMAHDEPPKIEGMGSMLSTQSSLSNGEINLESINDRSEIPIDNSESLASSH
ncbi:hypothetical protein GCK72_005236 [Caenorhabditis remanei]|uniref:Uncharacterized protein n=2 Tax=Caenorhabditis remanei TaxID=31234 RepID=A0A6A5HEN2_CAERE|nr:hypothetical protein GCK72_005236 [Caenorhabditis remanei]KAF1765284.1 hypothetical protein GCK72_005236 [Caenorhabditis remanei]